MHLIAKIATALKIDSRALLESKRDEYTLSFCAPAVSHTVHLDFHIKDEHGKFATPECALKRKVPSSVSSRAVKYATGAVNPAHGVLGMAGVGKTIALEGLASDKYVCSLFTDGIQYLGLGQAASVQTAIQEIARVMRLTGATVSVAPVESSTSLREAVDYAFQWFQNKKCLLLIDDLWPTEACPTGYLFELRQLLRESPESRMAVSTRSTNIAVGAGSIVDFAARDPLGPVSVAIFMAHAMRCSRNNSGDISPSISKILARCGGLPIALSICGCAVALLERHLEASSALVMSMCLIWRTETHVSVPRETDAEKACPRVFFSASSTSRLSF